MSRKYSDQPRSAEPGPDRGADKPVHLYYYDGKLSENMIAELAEKGVTIHHVADSIKRKKPSIVAADGFGVVGEIPSGHEPATQAVSSGVEGAGQAAGGRMCDWLNGQEREPLEEGEVDSGAEEREPVTPAGSQASNTWDSSPASARTTTVASSNVELNPLRWPVSTVADLRAAGALRELREQQATLLLQQEVAAGQSDSPAMSQDGSSEPCTNT